MLDFSDFNKDDSIEIIEHLGRGRGRGCRIPNRWCTGVFCVDWFMKQDTQPVSETAKSRETLLKKIRVVPYSGID
jgi:hypothetical protein